jgi:hypothetical protein
MRRSSYHDVMDVHTSTWWGRGWQLGGEGERELGHMSIHPLMLTRSASSDAWEPSTSIDSLNYLWTRHGINGTSSFLSYFCCSHPKNLPLLSWSTSRSYSEIRRSAILAQYTSTDPTITLTYYLYIRCVYHSEFSYIICIACISNSVRLNANYRVATTLYVYQVMACVHAYDTNTQLSTLDCSDSIWMIKPAWFVRETVGLQAIR